MNKVDDEFERFLMDKAKDEKSKFYIPVSFDTKIEESLKEVDKISFNKSNRWYENKKIMAIAASFVFIFSLSLIRYSMKSNSNIDMARSMDQIANENATLEDSWSVEEVNENIYLKDLIHLKKVESIDVNGKVIEDEDKISKILYLLNSLPLKNSEAEFVDEDYTIEIKGENTYIIYMKENLLLINDVVYNTNTHEVENVKKEISNLISN